MATYDHTRGGNAAIAWANGFGRAPFVLEQSVDFALNNRLQNDVLQLIDIPAMTFVWKVVAIVETAEGGTLTFDIGDGSDVDGFLDGVDGNSAATSISALALTEAAPNTVTGYSNGKFYATADTLDMVVLNDADAAKVRILALCFDLSANGDPSS